MKRILVLSAVVIALCSYAFAEEPAKAAPQGRIGFVDLQRAADESDAGKKARAELEALVKQKQAAIDEKQTALKKFKEDLDKQAIVLSAKAKKEKEDKLRTMEREFEKLIEESEGAIEKERREKTIAVIKELEGVIEKLGKEDGYTIILVSDAILYAGEGAELTDRVIKLYNELKAAKEEPEKK